MRRVRSSFRMTGVCTLLVLLAGSAHAQPPNASDPAVGQALPPPAFDSGLPADIEARLNAMQIEIDELRGLPPGYGLEGGRRRSTDVPRVEDLQETPAFPKVKLTGFFQADAGWFRQSPGSFATFGDIQDATGFRRARLAAVGDVAENMSYMLEMDFAFPGRPSFMDVWLDVHSVPLLGNVRVGQWRQRRQHAHRQRSAHRNADQSQGPYRGLQRQRD